MASLALAQPFVGNDVDGEEQDRANAEVLDETTLMANIRELVEKSHPSASDLERLHSLMWHAQESPEVLRATYLAIVILAPPGRVAGYLETLQSGVEPGLGHSSMTAEEVEEAFASGVTLGCYAARYNLGEIKLDETYFERLAELEAAGLDLGDDICGPGFIPGPPSYEEGPSEAEGESVNDEPESPQSESIPPSVPPSALANMIRLAHFVITQDGLDWAVVTISATSQAPCSDVALPSMKAYALKKLTSSPTPLLAAIDEGCATFIIRATRLPVSPALAHVLAVPTRGRVAPSIRRLSVAELEREIRPTQQ